MAKYHNKKESRKIGSRIRALRESKEFNIEDIAFMTGFARNTITAIENGSNTDISHLIEIAKAIGVLPMELLDVPIEIKPRYKLSPKRLNKNHLTLRINKLISESDFFEEARFVNDVIEILTEEFKIKSNSTHTSVVLMRFVKEGKLKYAKVGRKNSYLKK